MSDKPFSIRRRIPIKFYDSASDEPPRESAEQSQIQAGAPDQPGESVQAGASSPPNELDQLPQAAGEASDETLSMPIAPLSPGDFAQLEAEKNGLQQRLLRLAMDFDNYRRRHDRERQEMQSQARLEVIKHLLPIVDNFERALESARHNTSRDQLMEGLELIYKQLRALLASFGVHPVESVGQPFDPLLHEAIATDTSGEFESNTVVQEYERGYKVGDRLLRPAKVKVSVTSD